MATMVERLLDAADKLLEEGPRSSAFKRRAVSTAYYAAFHALAKRCADCLLPSGGRTTQEYERIYRALDHGPLKQAFGHGVLKDNAALRQIGNIVVELQSARRRADYLPPIKKVFSRAKIRKHIGEARSAVSQIEALSPQDSRTLAASLLFKTRPE